MFESPEIKTSYRPDIDGLRAIAVIGVILFHLNPSLLPGGFLGVDVFFVISGYLITRILLRESENGGIRFGEFWKRRIRRLLPAFAVMVIGTCLLAKTFFPPTLAYSAGKQALAASIGVSNFYLNALTSNYWGSAAEWSPLLHTWSLSVEEQFYLLFPFVVAGLAFFRHRTVIVLALLALSIASAVSCVFIGKSDAAQAFFMPYGRAWELLIGALVALAGQTKRQTFSTNWAAPVGLLLIAMSYVLVQGGDFIPWPWSLGAVIGAGLICLGGGQGAQGTRWLDSSLMRWIGRSSYSLYLWHWPALVLGSALALARPGEALRELALIAGIGLGALSYVYIEPLGRKERFLTRLAPLFVMLLAVVVSVTSLSPDPRLAQLPGGCIAPPVIENKPAVLLVGDSHAVAVARVLQASAESAGLAYVQHIDHGIAIVSGQRQQSRSRLSRFQAASSERTQLVSRPDISVVVVVCRWETYTTKEDFGEIETVLSEWSRRNKKAKFILVKQPPRLDCGPFTASEWFDWLVRLGNTLNTRQKSFDAVRVANQNLSNIALKHRFMLVSAASSLDINADDESGFIGPEKLHLYSDDDHLSESGAERVVAEIMSRVAAELK